jgi:hypothetical protein
MNADDVRTRFQPALDEIISSCCVSENFVDKDQFRVYIATVWGNAALDPEKSGIVEEDLPLLHDFLNEEIQKLLGTNQTVTACYEYLSKKEGQEAMTRLKVNSQHKEFILYFAKIILAQA